MCVRFCMSVKYLFKTQNCVTVNEKSYEVLRWYWEKSHLASHIFNALNDSGSRGSFLSVVIVGKPGYGKTSYAYYALKTGIIKMLCSNEGFFNLDQCIKALETKYGELCISKNCNEPDPLDREYRWAYYTGITDLERFINDAVKLLVEDSVRRKVLFMDDLVTKSVFALGGKWRRAYMAFREVFRVARVGSSVIIMTATSPTLIPDFVKHASEYIAVWKYGKLFLYGRYIKYLEPNEDGSYTAKLERVFEDRVPIKAPFGLPKWLEEDINERKKQLIRDAVRLAKGDSFA